MSYARVQVHVDAAMPVEMVATHREGVTLVLMQPGLSTPDQLRLFLDLLTVDELDRLLEQWDIEIEVA